MGTASTTAKMNLAFTGVINKKAHFGKTVQEYRQSIALDVLSNPRRFLNRILGNLLFLLPEKPIINKLLCVPAHFGKYTDIMLLSLLIGNAIVLASKNGEVMASIAYIKKSRMASILGVAEHEIIGRKLSIATGHINNAWKKTAHISFADGSANGDTTLITATFSFIV